MLSFMSKAENKKAGSVEDVKEKERCWAKNTWKNVASMWRGNGTMEGDKGCGFQHLLTYWIMT